MLSSTVRNDYRYHHSTLEPEKYITQLNAEIRDFCHEQPLADEAAKQRLISRLLRRAGTAAYQGATRGEGGPFGAMLVDFQTSDGIPQVVGFGTNHVVPNSDPSAHAEMTAIRDTAKRLGRTDLSGLTLITSCECCPMCLSAATGCKVENIYFAATREDAAKIGFSDDSQYRLMNAGHIEMHAVKSQDTRAAEEMLQGHDAAVIVRHQGKTHRYFGDYAAADASDPTSIPCVQAVRAACAGMAELTGEKVFHLPEDTQLISRDMPHPLSLITADWARIGRVRGSDPLDPALDAQEKGTDRIVYLNDAMERMPVRDAAHSISAVAPERIWEEIKHPRAVQVDQELGRARLVAFEQWGKLISGGEREKY